MTTPRRPKFRRAIRWAALASLAAAALPLAAWAVPRLHPPPAVSIDWHDRRTWIYLSTAVDGFDRDGWVEASDVRTWIAADRSALNPVRRDHAAGRFGRPVATESWRPQWTEFGNNHVYLPGGAELTESGVRYAVPYLWMAAGLAAPAVLGGIAGAWDRRVRRRQPD